jgi:hypothetical protein
MNPTTTPENPSPAASKPAPSVNPSPKTRFMKMAPVILTRHRDMVSSDQFDMSSDFALAEMTRQLVQSSDGNQYYAMAAFLRLQGAVEYLSQLKNLAETPKLPTPATAATLDHRV